MYLIFCSFPFFCESGIQLGFLYLVSKCCISGVHASPYPTFYFWKF